MRSKIRKKIQAKKEAWVLIPALLKKSKIAYKEGNKKLSAAYSKKIKYLHMKHKIKLPNTIKRQLCRHCGSTLIPSLNCRIRTKEGILIVYCKECKNYARMPLK